MTTKQHDLAATIRELTQVQRSSTLDARDYGADPTGTTDSAPAVAALNATGGNVTWPRGRYRFGTDVTMPPGVAWSGEVGTVFEATGPARSASGAQVTLGHGCALTGVEVDAARVAGIGVTVRGADATMTDVTVRGSTFHGVYVNGNAGNGGAHRPILTRVRVHDSGGPTNPTSAGFYMAEVDGAKFTDCYATGSLQQGYYLAGYSDGAGLTMTGCTAEGNGAGIDVRVPSASLAACNAYGNRGAGLQIQQDDVGVPNTRVAVQGGVIAGNNTDSRTTFDVIVTQTGSVTLTGLVIESTAVYALSIQGAGNVVVTGCSIIGTQSGVQVKNIAGGAPSERVTLVGNNIRGGGAGNVVIASGAVDGLHLTANRIEGGVNGVRLVGAVSNTFVGPNQWASVTNRIKDESTGAAL